MTTWVAFVIYWKNTNNMQMMKSTVVTSEFQVKNMHLNCTIKSRFYDDINY